MDNRFRELKLKQISEMLGRAEPLKTLHRPGTGWIRAIRTALGMPQAYLAARLGVTKAAVAKYEAGEKEGALTLGTLRKVAHALDCDFAYVLIPREPLEQLRSRRAKEIARRTVGAVAQTMGLEDQAVPRGDLEARIDELAKVILTEHPNALWETG